MDLTFKDFQALNRKRRFTAKAFKRSRTMDTRDFAMAMGGEAGELLNVFKKIKRGDFTEKQARKKILHETADVITYAIALIDNENEDTAKVLMEKFEIVNRRIGWKNKRAKD